VTADKEEEEEDIPPNCLFIIEEDDDELSAKIKGEVSTRGPLLGKRVEASRTGSFNNEERRPVASSTF
jgi:hypothetical protein